MVKSDMMDTKQYDALMKELKVIRKLLAASLYASGVDGDDIHKITGMGTSDIKSLISLKKMRKRGSIEGKD